MTAVWCIAAFLLGAALGTLAALRKVFIESSQAQGLKVHAPNANEAIKLMDRLAKMGTDAQQQQILARGVAHQTSQPRAM